ncbi:MAG: tRNA (adenosine(37)-N6)-dimethylallyltransferase MiaA [Actinobacteria bacterium]|nr:tRNA (adenosine(37)-N6)-dimethylallyltransferase MiaA [Actinomycetota bacterium]
MSVLVICGATATGKSDLAVEIALEIGAEIVNADSMQLYRGMDIGTAKISVADRKGIPHNLLDVLDVKEDASVAWYQTRAREVIAEIESRGNHALIVGGTGLYIKAILDDLNFPDTNPAIRVELEMQASEIGLPAMHAKLADLDPAAGLAIDAKNLRRVIRALEVIKITDKPFTANLPRKESTRYPDAHQFGLVMERENLGERIDARVEKMWEQGFVAEVEELLELGITHGRTAQLALGYSQIIKYLTGDMTEDQAKEETKRATRQYARRQETWFSRDERIQWISLNQPRKRVILEKFSQPASSADL